MGNSGRKTGPRPILTLVRARAGLVRARTALVNTARGLAKSYGERLRTCTVSNLNAEKAEGLSPELQAAPEPPLNAIESLSERIVEYNGGVENLAQQSYPQVALLKQVKGIVTVMAILHQVSATLGRGACAVIESKQEEERHPHLLCVFLILVKEIYSPATPLLTRSLRSTLRFSARPYAVSFDAGGFVSPIAPGAAMFFVGTLQSWSK
jgi:hypothetical protein